MKKAICILMTSILVLGLANPVNVFAASYNTGTVSGGHSYQIIAATTGEANHYALLYSLKYNKSKDLSCTIHVSETVSAAATETIEDTLSAAAGTSINVFGTKANVEISNSIKAGLGITNTASRTISCSIAFDLKKAEDPVGYYVYETFTKGYGSYILFIDVQCTTGKVLKNVKKNIAFSPRVGYKPTGQYNYFTYDPQVAGRYD